MVWSSISLQHRRVYAGCKVHRIADRLKQEKELDSFPPTEALENLLFTTDNPCFTNWSSLLAVAAQFPCQLTIMATHNLWTPTQAIGGHIRTIATVRIVTVEVVNYDYCSYQSWLLRRAGKSYRQEYSILKLWVNTWKGGKWTENDWWMEVCSYFLQVGAIRAWVYIKLLDYVGTA